MTVVVGAPSTYSMNVYLMATQTNSKVWVYTPNGLVWVGVRYQIETPCNF